MAYSGFETLIKGITDIAKSDPQSKFHLICDLSEGYSVDCLKLFTRLRMMHESYRQRFTALSFADDCDYPPLQAADMLAYCFRRKFLKTDEGIIKRLLEIFGSGKPMAPRELAYEADSHLGDGIITLRGQ